MDEKLQENTANNHANTMGGLFHSSNDMDLKMNPSDIRREKINALRKKCYWNQSKEKNKLSNDLDNAKTIKVDRNIIPEIEDEPKKANDLTVDNIQYQNKNVDPKIPKNNGPMEDCEPDVLIDNKDDNKLPSLNSRCCDQPEKTTAVPNLHNCYSPKNGDEKVTKSSLKKDSEKSTNDEICIKKDLLRDSLEKCLEALETLHSEHANLKHKYECLKGNDEERENMRNENIYLKQENVKLHSEVDRLNTKVKTLEKKIIKETKEAANQAIPLGFFQEKFREFMNASDLNCGALETNRSEAMISREVSQDQRNISKKPKLFHNNSNHAKIDIKIMARFKPECNDTFLYNGENTVKINPIFYSMNKEAAIIPADQLFPPTCKQEDVFNGIKSYVASAVDGSKICLAAYGQTGSGKTFTIMGTKNEPGLVGLSIKTIFELVERRNGWNYTFRVSVLQVYNEIIIDLLNDKVSFLNVTDDVKGLYIADMIEKPIIYEEDFLEYIEISLRRRNSNRSWFLSNSSKSHCIVLLHIDGKSTTDTKTTRGLLTFCDLSGFDYDETSNTDIKSTPSMFVSKSLTAFSNVLLAMYNNKTVIPYRDSRLTHLLKCTLSEASKCVVILTVSTLKENLLCSLKTLEIFQEIVLKNLNRNKTDKADDTDNVKTVANPNKKQFTIYRRNTDSLTKIPVRNPIKI